jgi:enediyne biosynthesis protein E4
MAFGRQAADNCRNTAVANRQPRLQGIAPRSAGKGLGEGGSQRHHSERRRVWAGKRPTWVVLSAMLLQGFPAASAESQTAATAIRLVDVAGEAGIDFVVDNSAGGRKYQIETMISGVALFDFDNDGLLDVYFTNGAEIPSLEKTGPRFWNRLYRNRGGLKFADVTERAGVRGSGYSMGVAAGDFDNDGWTDLYVTGVNLNTLFRNQGDGTFRDVTTTAGVEGTIEEYGKAWAVGAAWFDYDLDGDLDLLVVNYCVWSLETEPNCGAPRPGYRTYCHPRMYDPLPNILYRNNGDGTFTDVSVESGIGKHPGKGMGVTVADFDGNGLPDIFVSNDGWRNFYFRNLGKGRFEETAFESGLAYIDDGRAISGMGADSGDIYGVGRFDIVMTALSNETFPVFQNLGSGVFRDARFSSRVGVLSLPHGGWSMGLVDLDNDGNLDWFAAAAHVQTNEELYSNRASLQPNRVFENRGDGTFADVSAQVGESFQQVGMHRGAAFGDLDNDGLVDVVVTRLNDGARVFHNRTSPAGGFLTVRLEGTKANRAGLGAEIRLKLRSGQVLLRQAKAAVGYGSSSDPRVHFGLGDSQVESLLIRWPGGQDQEIENPPTNNILTIRQETGVGASSP